MSIHILMYFPLFVALMSLAALFVYRPKKFKVLPWIVLAIMGFAFFCMALNDFTIALLTGERYGGPMTIISNPGYVIGRFFWIGKADLWLVGQSKVYAVVCAIPILALWGILIVGAVQKKKKGS